MTPYASQASPLRRPGQRGPLNPLGQVDRIPQAELLEGLRHGVPTVLPNARAARALRAAFDAEQSRLGLRAWASPPALSWSEWTHQLWTALLTSGAESRVLLNAVQEDHLWRDLIQVHFRESAPERLPGIGALAELARSAWSRAAAWGVTQRLRSAANTHDTRTFALWAEELAQRCSLEGLLPQAALEEALADHLQREHLPAPAELRVIGFADLPPAPLRLLNALRDRGTDLRVSHWLPAAAPAAAAPAAMGTPDGPAGRFLAVAPDERGELLLATQWVGSRVRQAQHAETTVRIGVLLPPSGVDRAEFEAVLREVLTPELEAVSADLSSQPWAFAQGEPLGNVSLVSDLMGLAQLCAGPVSLEDATSVLLSPYLGSLLEAESKARFDAYTLRASPRLRAEITLRELAALAAAEARNYPERTAPAPWLQAVAEFATRALDPKLRRSFAEWTEVLRRLAATAGWPGDRQLSAREFEASRAWEQGLDLIATLDFGGQRVAFSEALHAVGRQLATAAFTPPEIGSSILILTPEQALGSPFDALVCLRGHDENWPSAARLHPLLPASLQRELAMPGADAGREGRLVASLLDTAPVVLATCAAENAEGRLRVSPLFSELGFRPLAAPEMAVRASFASPLREEAVSEEVIPDDAPLPQPPSPEVRGGARVLQLQAACGFLAFAAVRLGSTELEARDAGFDARENGTLLHRSLEHLWKRIHSQDELRALAPEQRRRLLEACIEEAVPSRLAPETEWDRAYLDLQKARLLRLLDQWMEHELRRGAFRVADSEREERIAVGPLALTVRIDRIDQVEGGVVLVDYKSGLSADPKSWQGDRPDEPQLPLYTLRAAAEEIQGVTFARVRAGSKMRWAGFAAVPGILPPTGPRASEAPMLRNLTDQIAQWRTDLTRLADNFYGGQTLVSPKSFTVNCTRCAQRLLCRLDPATLRPEREDDPETGEHRRDDAFEFDEPGEALHG